MLIKFKGNHIKGVFNLRVNKCKFILSIILSIIVLSNGIIVKASEPKKLYIDARCAIAMDSKSKVVLYEKNANNIVPMASTTKIMTALVAIKYGNLDKKFIISKRAGAIRGSTVGYKVGEEITLKELLYGLMFRSGNDAAIAIAEGIGGSVDNFIKLMNEYALEIGAVNSHFVTPHGLDSEFHYCTAYDLALITAKAKENKIFDEIVSAKDISPSQFGFTRGYHNINKILNLIPNANGVKTGYTGNAGKCLVTSVNIEGHDVIFVVLNCTPRWKETKKMYDYVVKNYSYKKIVSKGDKLYEGKINNGKNILRLYAPHDVILPCMNNENYKIRVCVPHDINATICKNDKVGKIEVYKDKERVFIDYLVSNEVKGKRIWKNTSMSSHKIEEVYVGKSLCY